MSDNTDEVFDDDEAHYDLGTAYRKMGLLDDAIAEFRKAMRHGQYAAPGHLMVGICQVELGRNSDAAESFQQGLCSGDLLQRERLALLYELGDSYARDGDIRAASVCFSKVFDEDPGYRDVAAKVGRTRKPQ